MNDSEVTLAEAARMLGVPYPSVYVRWRKGFIPYARGKGGTICVKVLDVAASLSGYQRRGEIVPTIR
jgi:hypothetical protein